MDIFKNLPFLNKGAEAEVQTEEEIRKARILFHREHVRVGPLGKRRVRQDHHALAVTFANKPDARRAKREQAKQVASNYERAKQQHFSERAESALLRGQLQAVGLLPYVLAETEIDPVLARNATIYLIHRFADAEGTVEVTEELVRDSLQSALNRWESLVRRPITKIPDDYVLPVQVANA